MNRSKKGVVEMEKRGNQNLGKSENVYVNITRIPIRMSHWRHLMVDGAKFWFSFQWLEILRKAGRW